MLPRLVSLFTKINKWEAGNNWSTIYLTNCLELTCGGPVSHPGEGGNIPSHFILPKSEISIGHDGPEARSISIWADSKNRVIHFVLAQTGAPVSRIPNGSNPFFLNLELRVLAR